jgi:hypothetical protein
VSDPTTTNRAAGIINGILKNLIDGVGVQAAETAAIAAYPFLAWPIVKQIFEGVLNLVANEIYKQAAMAATKVVIDVQVGVEESTALNAFQSLQMAIASGDEVAIKKASDDLDSAYGNLIHMDGWSSP